jgi:hypothetical protein
MSGDPFDAQGEAHEALSTAVGSYGARVLSDPRILGNLVTDLLPDSPRERSLLVTAAEAGVASELAQHVDQQHLDADTAVELVARALTDRRSIDIAASTWVTTEYARALGYQVRSSSTPPGQFGGQPGPSPTATVRRPGPSPVTPPFPGAQPPAAQSPGTAPLFPQGPQPVQSPGTAPLFGQPPGQGGGYNPQIQQSPVTPPLPFNAAGGQGGYQPPSAPSGYQPPPGYQSPSTPSGYQSPSTPSGYQPPSAAPGGYQQTAAFASPGTQPSSGYGPTSSPYQPVGTPSTPAWGAAPPPKSSRRGLLFGGIGGGAVIIIAIVAIVLATGGHGTTSTHSGPSVQPSVVHPSVPSTPSPSIPSTPSPTPTPTIPPGITPLVKLLPSDINDFETECKSQTASQLPFKETKGLVSALKCSDPGLPGGTVFAFQFDSAHDYVQAWGSFNSWWGFNPSSAGTNCPPSGSSVTAQGVTGWNSGVYPSHSGQEVECQYVTVSGTSTAKSNLEPDYVWSYPTEYAFIDGQGAPGSSFTALQTWWHNT